MTESGKTGLYFTLEMADRPSARCADRSFNIQCLRGLLNNSCVNVVVGLHNRCHFSHRGFLMPVLGPFQNAIPMSCLTAGVCPISKAEVLETSAASAGLSFAKLSVKNVASRLAREMET